MSQEEEYKRRLAEARREAPKMHARKNDTTPDKQSGAFGETAKSLRKVTRGSKLMAPLRALSLAMKLRGDVENHESAPWIIALVIAIACDMMDTIPVAGWIITLFFRPFLFVFLWGKGTWKMKLIYYTLLLLDFFPILNLLPLSTACVVYAFLKSKNKANFATNSLREIKSEFKSFHRNI